MRSRFAASLIPLCLTVVFFSGCVRRTLSPLEEYTRVPELSDEDRATIVGILQQQAAAVQSLQATAEVRVAKFPGSQRVEQVLVFDRRYGLRLEFFDPAMHRLLGLVVVEGNRLSAIDTEKRQVLVGTATASHLERTLSLPLTPDEVMLLFCGQFAVSASDAELSLKRHPSRAEYVLEKLLTPKLRLRLVILGDEQHGLFVERATIFPTDSDKIKFDAKFTYGDDRDPLQPSTVGINLPEKQVESELSYVSRRFNVPGGVDAARFVLQIPSRYQLHHLDLDETK